jgi:truncated hemoglobin YjbI
MDSPSRKLSFSFDNDSNSSTPLFARIGGGEKCLRTLANTFFELVYNDTLIGSLYIEKNIPMNPDVFHRYVLHVLGKKPYDPTQIRELHSKLGFREKHFKQFIFLFGQALGMLNLKECVMRDILAAAVATRADLKAEPIKGTVSFW